MTTHLSPENGDIELGLTFTQLSDQRSARETNNMLYHSRAADLDHPPQFDESQSQSIMESASFLDSAYVSKAPTATAATFGTTIPSASMDDATTSTLQDGRRLKGTDWYWFNMPVNKTAREHYGHVVSKINTFLTKAIRNTSKERSRKLAVKVRVIGKTKMDARVRLVVLCKPEVEKDVRKEMNDSYVTDILSYNRPNIPQLDFLVIADAPTLVSKYLDVDVCCNNSFAHNCDTFCGAPILFQYRGKDSNKERRRLGTFGGMIEVTYAESTQLLGMTAGHTVERLQRTQSVEYSETEDERTDAFNLGDLDSWICEHNVLGAVLDTSSMPAVSDGKVVKSHDWALFEVKKPRPNLAVHTLSRPAGMVSEDAATHEILQAERPQFNDDLSDPVLLLGGKRGTRRGELLSLPASICIGGTLLDAYTLEVHEEEVCDGDSGAWVVHSASPILYGHVVATDVFGDAYIIPALDTLENIKNCLGAVSVRLPTNTSTLQSERRSSDLTSKGKRGKRRHITFQKRWNACFLTDRRRTVNDGPYIQDIQNLESVGDVMDIFLQDFGVRYTSFGAEEVKNFCDGVNLDDYTLNDKAVERRSAWIDDKSVSGDSRIYPSRISARELHRILSQKRFGVSILPDADRRLIYISEPDPYYIVALAKTAPHHQIDILRDAIWKYLAFQTSIRVSLKRRGYAIFQMEFHLPHFELRHRFRPMTQPAGKNKSNFHEGVDIDFLEVKGSLHHQSKKVLYEARISFWISGTGNKNWTAYCFSDTSFDDGSEDDQDEGSDCDTAAWDWDIDPILSDNTNFVHLADKPIWDPREYFLAVFEKRIGQVLSEYGHLVRAIEHAIFSYRKDNFVRSLAINSSSCCQTLDWTAQTMEILNKVRGGCINVIQVYKRFLSTGGDAEYFRDSPACNRVLFNLQTTLEEFTDLERRLCHLDDICKQWSQKLQIKMAFESNQLLRQSNMSQHVHQGLLMKVSELMREQNRAAQRSSTGTDVAILALPFVLVSTFFSIPGDDMTFKRTVPAFVLALVSVTVAFQMMLWALRFRGNFFRIDIVKIRGPRKSKNQSDVIGVA